MLQFIHRDHQEGKMNFELKPLKELGIEIIAKEINRRALKESTPKIVGSHPKRSS